MVRRKRGMGGALSSKILRSGRRRRSLPSNEKSGKSASSPLILDYFSPKRVATDSLAGAGPSVGKKKGARNLKKRRRSCDVDSLACGNTSDSDCVEIVSPNIGRQKCGTPSKDKRKHVSESDNLEISKSSTPHTWPVTPSSLLPSTTVKNEKVKGFGFVRVHDSETLTSPFPTTATETTTYPLFKGAILGRRTSHSNPLSTSPQKRPKTNKIDLGIKCDADGVSRKQIEVLSFYYGDNSKDSSRKGTPPFATLKVCENAMNPVGYIRFRTKSKSSTTSEISREGSQHPSFVRKFTYVNQGISIQMKLGDMIEFDTYNRDPVINGGQSKPKYVFKLVPYDPNPSKKLDAVCDDFSEDACPKTPERARCTPDGKEKTEEQSSCPSSRTVEKFTPHRILESTVDNTVDTKDKANAEDKFFQKPGEGTTEQAERMGHSKSFAEETTEQNQENLEEEQLPCEESIPVSLEQELNVVPEDAKGVSENSAEDDVCNKLVSDERNKVETENDESQISTCAESKLVSPLLDSCFVEEIDNCLSQDSIGATPRETRAKAKEIHPSLSHSMWRALDSAEPHNGIIRLKLLSAVHNVLPNSSLALKLFDLIKFGPQSDGARFKDPNRMELASRYSSDIIYRSNILETSSLQPYGPLSWNEVEHCLSQPAQEMNDTNIHKLRNSSARLRVFGSSFHACACALETIEALLQSELLGTSSCVTEKPMCVKETSACQRTCEVILDRGVRDALKSTFKWVGATWIRHGGWLLRASDSSVSGVEFYVTQVTRCLNALGRISSLITLFCCSKENIKLGSKDCLFLVKNAFLLGFEQGEDHSSEKVGNKGKKMSAMAAKRRRRALKRLKVFFVLSLDEKIVNPLLHPLAKVLGVSKELMVISGNV